MLCMEMKPPPAKARRPDEGIKGGELRTSHHEARMRKVKSIALSQEGPETILPASGVGTFYIPGIFP
jgi:hypothetical protein